MNVVPMTALTAEAARALTDELKADAETLWQRLLTAYERNVHGALGYPSWAAYCKTEFGASKSRAYQLLDAARVTRAIQSTMVDSQLNERVVRELVPVLKEKGEEAVTEAWTEAVETHGPTPTAAETRSTVMKKNSDSARPKRGSNKDRLNAALDPVDRYLKNWTEYALRGITPGEARALLRKVQRIDKELLELERALDARTVVPRALK